MKTAKWEHKPIILYGKEIMQPRLTAFYGEDSKEYPYSGIKLNAVGWLDILVPIKEKVEALSGAKFNIALLNQYRDGKDSVSWHRDDEKGMGSNPTIASVSFGATRNFQVRTKQKDNRLTFPLSHGNIVFMRGAMQSNWEHCVPKTAKPVGTRINITFRYALD